MYYIINKIELENGAVTHTPVGYTDSDDDVLEYQSYLDSFKEWSILHSQSLEDGAVSLSSFFNANTTYHQIGWETTDISGLNVPSIELKNL